MDIVVKLPDKDYSVILTKIMLACRGCKIIELPKGHGRLKDVDKIIRDGINKGFCDWYDEMKYAQTIIEADKAEIEPQQSEE